MEVLTAMNDMEPKAREKALLAWLQSGLSNPAIELELISGDASFRRYFRVMNHDCPIMAVDAPPPHENCSVFLQVSRAYQVAAVRVPETILTDETQGFMALEDFGDRLLLADLNDTSKERLYSAAIAQLPAIASVVSTEQGPLPLFNREHIARENALFTDWLLATHLELELSSHEQKLIQAAFETLTESAITQPQVGVHRDYHARNLMLLPHDDLGVIDFQDAVLGPVTYDLVSLLRDCYIEWPDEWVYQKLNEWAQLMGLADKHEQLIRWFDLTGIQRHVKASGIFCRLCHRDGKIGYLGDVPRTLGYIARIAAKYPELADFSKFVQHRVLPAWQQTQ